MSRVHEEIHKAIFDFLKSILSPCFRDRFCLTIDKSTNKKNQGFVYILFLVQFHAMYIILN